MLININNNDNGNNNGIFPNNKKLRSIVNTVIWVIGQQHTSYILTL